MGDMVPGVLQEVWVVEANLAYGTPAFHPYRTKHIN